MGRGTPAIERGIGRVEAGRIAEVEFAAMVVETPA